MSLNQLTIMILDKILEEKEPGVLGFPEIPEEQNQLEKEYYRCVYFILWFNMGLGVGSKEY